MKEETMSKPSTELNSQTPAEGILKRNNWGDAITYQVVVNVKMPITITMFGLKLMTIV
jgi:hypothetical protein